MVLAGTGPGLSHKKNRSSLRSSGNACFSFRDSATSLPGQHSPEGHGRFSSTARLPLVAINIKPVVLGH